MLRSTRFTLALAALCASGTTLLGGMAASAATPADTASPQTQQTWSLQSAMQADPTDNPILGGDGSPLWSYYAGAGQDPSTYTLLSALSTSSCGVQGFYAHRVPGGGDLPLVGYNGSGQDVSCGTPYNPAGTVVVHPSDTPAVIAWTSPINGTVSLSGDVIDHDGAGGDGVSYDVFTGSTDVASGTMDNGSQASFASASDLTVSKGQVVYLQIGPRGNYSYDSTGVDLVITDTTPTPPTPAPTLSSSAPKSIDQQGTKTVTLKGQNFDADTQVSLDDSTGLVLGPPQVISAQKLKLKLYAASAAPTLRHWLVSDGSSTPTGCATCTIQVVRAPYVASITPSTVAQGGTYDLALFGANFTPDMTAAFSGTGVTVTAVTVASGDDSHATISIAVDPTAKKGKRNLTLAIPGEGKYVDRGAITVTTASTAS